MMQMQGGSFSPVTFDSMDPQSSSLNDGINGGFDDFGYDATIDPSQAAPGAVPVSSTAPDSGLLSGVYTQANQYQFGGHHLGWLFALWGTLIGLAILERKVGNAGASIRINAINSLKVLLMVIIGKWLATWFLQYVPVPGLTDLVTHS